MKRLIIVALTCSVFGGTIGALATAATQSQASPRAIAAAVQRVEDQSAERSLRQIGKSLRTTTGRLGTLVNDFSPTKGEILQLAEGEGSNYQKIETDLTTLNTTITGFENDSRLTADSENLAGICEDTSGPDNFRCTIP